MDETNQTEFIVYDELNVTIVSAINEFEAVKTVAKYCEHVVDNSEPLEKTLLWCH